MQSGTRRRMRFNFDWRPSETGIAMLHSVRTSTRNWGMLPLCQTMRTSPCSHARP